MKNRIITISNIHDAREILKQIGVSSQGVEVMAPKALGPCLLLYNVETGAANIMKQEALIIGADVAMSKGIVEGKKKETNLLFMGGANKLLALHTRMRHYTSMGLPEIREQLLTFRKQLLYCSLEDKGRDFVPEIMGILNVTPDSFSDGNEHFDLSQAVKRGLEMIKEGASIIDIGGESTRPGSPRVSLQAELQRVIPVIKAIRQETQISISVDTYKAEVARQALSAGANIVNDITALQGDSGMIKVLQDFPQSKICIMHMQGSPETMQKDPTYSNVINDLMSFFEERISYLLAQGIFLDRIIIDPGIGFGKELEHNLAILKRLDEFHILGCKLLLGASRKSFINMITPALPKEREGGTMASSAIAYNKKIDIIRVHNVKDNAQLLKVLSAIEKRPFEI
ncbi:dihydropteroate synthase [bacterium]|nr:dihydropteroate synthase [bacterium]